MERLALPQEVEIELVPGIALDALGEELDGEVAQQACHALQGRRAGDGQGDQEESRWLPAGYGDQVEGSADEDLPVAVGPVVGHGGQDGPNGEERVTHGVRHDPAERPAPVVAVGAVEGELTLR